MKGIKWIRYSATTVIILYSLCVLYLMLFGFGRSNIQGEELRYNLIPFVTIKQFLQVDNFNFMIWFINIVGNIGVFVPFGVLIPIIIKVRLWKFILLFMTSITIMEVLQMLSRRGSFDIDDIILNTLGVLIGYSIYRCLLFIVRSTESSGSSYS
ncbi:VanZ family protein [Paenibacillus marinisediminis]